MATAHIASIAKRDADRNPRRAPTCSLSHRYGAPFVPNESSIANSAIGVYRKVHRHERFATLNSERTVATRPGKTRSSRLPHRSAVHPHTRLNDVADK